MRGLLCSGSQECLVSLGHPPCALSLSLGCPGRAFCLFPEFFFFFPIALCIITYAGLRFTVDISISNN